MKRTALAVLAAAMATAMPAQKRIAAAGSHTFDSYEGTEQKDTMTFSYNDDGKLLGYTGSTEMTEDDMPINMKVDGTYEWNGTSTLTSTTSASASVLGMKFSATVTSVFAIENGRATAVDVSMKGNMGMSGSATITYTYDADGKIAEAKYNGKDAQLTAKCTWEDGNIARIEYSDGETRTFVTNYKYTDLPTPAGWIGNAALPFSSSDDNVDSGWAMFGYSELFGTQCKNLPASCVTTENGETQGSETFRYNIDADGYPVASVTTTLDADGEEEEVAYDYYTWTGTPLSAINSAKATANTAEIDAIYSVSGARLQHLQKGVNILRMNDGTTRKVIMK